MPCTISGRSNLRLRIDTLTMLIYRPLKRDGSSLIGTQLAGAKSDLESTFEALLDCWTSHLSPITTSSSA
jgi:hypothetical protein